MPQAISNTKSGTSDSRKDRLAISSGLGIASSL